MMRLLLDTHVVLWWLEADPRIEDEVLGAISSTENEVFVSAVSATEIAIKSVLGKLRTPDDLELQVTQNWFTPLPLTIRHGQAVGELPLHHRDPFDRMLIAQARCEGLTLVTADKAIQKYDVPLLVA